MSAGTGGAFVSSGYSLMWKLAVPAPPSNAPALVTWANDSFEPSPQVHPLVCQTAVLVPAVSTEPSPTAAAAVGAEKIVPGSVAARRPPVA